MSLSVEVIMKITQLKHYVVPGKARNRNYVFVVVKTDEGIDGLGEATLEGRELAMAGMLDQLRPAVIGQDPLRRNYIWERLWRGGFWRGGPVHSSAVAGIDIALWDIQGKALGVPVYQLLGGALRDRVRCYGKAGGDTPEEAARQVKAYRDAGWDAVKIGGIGGVGFESGISDLEREIPRGIERLAAIREAGGDEMWIGIDLHGRLMLSEAVDYCTRAQPYRPGFVEEPIRCEGPESIRGLRAAIHLPLATGERIYDKWSFRGLIEEELVDFVQPDMCHAGGITEVAKIAALGEAHHIRIAPHNPLSPVSSMACIHFALATPNFYIQEIVDKQPEELGLVLEGGPKLIGGYAQKPEEPGLGIRLNEEDAAAMGREDLDIPQLHTRDGGVAEW